MNTPSRDSSPPDSNGILLQNSTYIGITIQNILYGVELTLYLKTLGILLENRGRLKKLDIFWGVFSSVMVFLTTVWVSTTSPFCQRLWLAESTFPGGALAYWRENLSVWYLDWGYTAVILLQLMTDGLMIYRCWTIWNTCYPIFVPVILWLATLGLGVAVDWARDLRKGDMFTCECAQLALAYYGASVFLNTLSTCMICYRILQYGRRVREQHGHDRASMYFSIVSLVIESVLPYTLSGIAVLVSLGVGSQTSAAFIAVYFSLMCISPQTLIVRVLAGRAWDRDVSRLALESGVNSNSGPVGPVA